MGKVTFLAMCKIDSNPIVTDANTKHFHSWNLPLYKEKGCEFLTFFSKSRGFDFSHKKEGVCKIGGLS